MGDEANGENQTEGQGNDGTQQPSQAQQQEAQTVDGGKAKEGYEAALAERDAKIAELERQVADAAKNAESAEVLTKQINELKEASAAERTEYELKLAGCRSVRAGRVLLADHKGDMEALKKAEPWLFGDAEQPGGTTGLEPAGPAGKGDGDELARWREIAGLDGQE